MDVKRAFRIGVATLCVAASAIVSWGQTAPSTYDPSRRQTPAKAQEGFVDFTLKRINPSDKDYGQCVDQGRALIIDETVRNGYFWSNLVALGLLGCLLVIIIFQQRIAIRREWATAEILAQCEESLRRSSTQAHEATRRNHAFQEALTGLRDSTLRAAARHSDSAETSASAVTKTRATVSRATAGATVKPTPDKPAAARDGGGAMATEPADQMGLFKSDAALVMKVNALEQQLVRAQEQGNELRRQLNDAGRKLQAEQEKNRALKGT